MTWTEHAIGDAPLVLTFPDGSRVVATYESVRGSPVGNVRLVYPSGASIELRGAADDGETTDFVRVFVLAGSPIDRLLILGGEVAYRINTRGDLAEPIPLDRTAADAEYWSTEIRSTPSGLAVICEGEVLLVGEDLTVKFHAGKAYNDFLTAVSGNTLWFTLDHEETWSMTLDASGGEPSRDYRDG